ncbi:Protein kinase domain [Macleaya cordata]|uniref:Protein kinase domain n=1 Tax=Macleaya cordata TaxID=56857 RepID=A0A200Q2A2_MACCD|nr:Protein kinase domain [Macleaya cordata]
MGHNHKKKKKGGHGGRVRKSKGRAPLDDHASHDGDDGELLSEELTALHAIFQEDIKVVSESPPQFMINLRPYSKDIGSDDLHVSALLSVRCLPGYPYKCPKLQITPEKGLSKDDADKLLSLLHDQANFNAREGRVMIFNLVEAAQEFLSEIVPLGQSNESDRCLNVERRDQWLHGDVAIACDKTHSSGGPCVYGLIDLFSGYGESWDWGLGTDKSGRNSLIHAHTLDASNVGYRVPEKQSFLSKNALALQALKQGPTQQPITQLDALKEERGDENKRLFAEYDSGSLVEESSGNGSMLDDQELKVLILEEQETKVDDSDLDEPSDSQSSTSVIHGQGAQSVKKDLILVHLLRVACASKGPLADALPEITSELYNLGIFSEQMRDLATEPPVLFNKAFDNVFRQHLVSSPNSQFWKAAPDFGGQTISSLPSSRYLSDFEELCSLGHGGFGHVALCKNKLDGRQYAVKKIRLKDKSKPVNDRILREVATLSRLQHQHVVRYYQAWFETEVGGNCGDVAWGSMTAGSSSYSYKGPASTKAIGPDNNLESTYLYIQMEYCPRTLRQVFESYSSLFGKEFAWHLFRQIVEGLAHIHAQGIIHRDLTPSNIFFDARNDIKIGDFGLAKFLKLEQLDHDPLFPTDTTGVSVDGTGQVGTYFYTAPEIEQGWPKIDEKVDMYSLGVVFFELWHPFGTAMERHIVLSDLKQKGALPPSWISEFPEQAALLQRLMSPSPSDRPSATELLQNALPPRMEDEWLDDILRAMQSPEDTHVYEKVVQKIFDEERLMMRAHRQHGVRLKLARDVSSFIQYTESDTELRDYVIDIAKEVFRLHCGKRMEITPMRLLDDCQQLNRNAVKLLTQEGDMLELCHELRLPFANWVITNQKSSFKRYEISWVYRRAIGHSTPNRYLQGDFDIIGGASALTEAEIIKVVMDIVTRFFHSDLCHIRLNHASLLDAIWTWVGIEVELRESVAQLLSVMGSLRPQSSNRKSSWNFIRRQLLQDLNLPEVVVNRLQTVDLRFCGIADQALPRLMGALPPDKHTRKALEELSALFGYLRVWKIERNVYIDALMPPQESYHRELFFQIFTEGTLLAVGGRYDHLLYQMWDHNHKSNPPGAVGTSLALETIFHQSSVEVKPPRNEASIHVLVCSRGGGGLLEERMELAAELWQANIKAEFVPMLDPSLTEQYEYANEHDIKFLIIITETGLSQTGSIKVRHLELKKEKKVERGSVVKFLLEATYLAPDW